MTVIWERLLRTAVEALEWEPGVAVGEEPPRLRSRVVSPTGRTDQQTAIWAVHEFDKLLAFDIEGGPAAEARKALAALVLAGADATAAEHRYRLALVDAAWAYVKDDPVVKLRELAAPHMP